MTVPVTTFFASVFALIFVLLSIHVIRCRTEKKQPLGHGDDPELMRRLRAHANFAEYIPFAIFLLFLAEWHAMNPWIIGLLYVALLLGRCSHLYSYLVHEARSGKRIFRIIGMALTFTVLATAAIINLLQFLMS
ncbi:MAG: MAPEG family protein [Alphaproteobacteria bacterium]|nr:MAPEG family protein [Alphaproteobacteria bacterium]